jgi:hypothetical protein
MAVIIMLAFDEHKVLLLGTLPLKIFEPECFRPWSLLKAKHRTSSAENGERQHMLFFIIFTPSVTGWIASNSFKGALGRKNTFL